MLYSKVVIIHSYAKNQNGNDFLFCWFTILAHDFSKPGVRLYEKFASILGKWWSVVFFGVADQDSIACQFASKIDIFSQLNAMLFGNKFTDPCSQASSRRIGGQLSLFLIG